MKLRSLYFTFSYFGRQASPTKCWLVPCSLFIRAFLFRCFFFSFFSSTFFSLTCLHVRFPQDVGKFCFDKSRNETLSAAFGVFPNRKVLYPPRSIYIFFYFPFKLNEWPIKRIKHQSCISRPDIDTEIRLVTMFLDSVI